MGQGSADVSPSLGSDHSPIAKTSQQRSPNGYRVQTLHSIDHEADLSDGINDGVSHINKIKNTRLDHTDKNEFTKKNSRMMISTRKTTSNLGSF